MDLVCSDKIKQYFLDLDKEIKKTYTIAKNARKKGLDPEKDVSIPLAKNMAQRVVGLISVVCPKIVETTVTQRIAELEKVYGQLDWRVGLTIAEEIAKEKFLKFETKQEAIEIGIRTGFAYLTLGIVSAPLEGFIGITIKKRKDGREYLAIKYAGPIRGAGGTAASTSVILSDYVRVKMGYAPYDPDEKEVNRYTSEVHDYHDRVTNLQYHPSDEELKFMISHLPIEVDGDPTEKFEVSNYKDIPRIETNLIRGGMCLVVAEGLCQKAPKLWKRLGKWGKEMDLEWDFLGEFLKLKEEIHAKHSSPKKEEKEEDNSDKPKRKTPKPNNTFIMDLVAGRPILTYPMQAGGFRLRYGKNRTSGFSAAAAHSATMVVLDDFISIGTQLKMERPGKGATITLCDTLEGPIVRLEDGNVLQLTSYEQAKKYNRQVEEILFLGDILFNYGDFSENGHALVPAGYCEEWWALEVEKSLKENQPKQKELEQSINKERLKILINKPLFNFPTLKEAYTISKLLDLPLHPKFTSYWILSKKQEVINLLHILAQSKIVENKTCPDSLNIKKIILPLHSTNTSHQECKKTLENIGLSHTIINKESIIIEKEIAASLLLALGIDPLKKDNSFENQIKSITNNSQSKQSFDNALDFINTLSSFKINDKAGTFIGARMGRPEKAKMRHLTGSPQVMFPVGEEGGRLRSFQQALKEGKIRSHFPNYYCDKCEKDMVYPSCEECKSECSTKYFCRFCGDLDLDTCRHGKAQTHQVKDINIKYLFEKAKERIGAKIVPDLIKGVRGTSNREHVVEHLSKGILRAKHKIYVNKDGTTRVDCTQLPLTHFKPKEIHTSVEKLKEIGYTHDINDEPLTNDNQLLEIKPQDIILPGYGEVVTPPPKVLRNVANFVDDLLVNFYGLKPFYNIKKLEDLVGHLVIGLAPHISAGLIGRIIGYSDSQGLLTNPMYHAGLRRDCDGDEAAVMLLMDSLLNFSRKFLPSSRGSTMDAPLVLTSFLDPAEVDDQVHGVDVMWKYPLEFYEAAMEMKNPWEVKHGPENKKIEQLAHRLGTIKQYEDFGFTHHVDDINKAPLCSAYKTLPSMKEKLVGQMEIAKKVRAVDMGDVAKLVIQKHFLKDIKGNLKKYSMQQFRCVGCNEKYRRPPLSNKCTTCNGKIIFTISQGSVVKYLGPSLLLVQKYEFSPYLKETLDILQLDVDNIFGREKEKQVGLGDFIK